MKYEVMKADHGLMIKDILKRRMNFSTRLIRASNRFSNSAWGYILGLYHKSVMSKN